MQKNDIVEIKITGMTDEGSGVGRYENIAVFVPYALLGETVKAHIIKVNKSYCIGKLMEVIHPSQSRIKSDCDCFYQCGGCSYRNVDYEEELSYKFNQVKDAIERIGKIKTNILPVLGGERCLYRNKAQFPVSETGAGLYARHSHRVIDTDNCVIQNGDSVKILNTVKDFMKEFSVSGYNEESHSGDIRNIYTRTGGGKTLVCIVTRTDSLPHKDELVEKILSLNIPIWGILQNINSNRTNVVLSKEMRLLWGQDFMYDNIGDFKFKISPLSFYQVNPAQTKVLYDTVKKFLGNMENETIWDLYCGTGTIGQYAASQAKRLVGVEITPEAVLNAEENALLNGIKNCIYYTGAAETLAPKLVREGGKPSAVILDPPRKGCDKKLLDAVVSVAPEKIVYVSCKPSTLARDMAYLKEKGYETQIVQPVDMFPGTCHVETCVLLSKLKSSKSVSIELDLDDLEITAAEAKATYGEIKGYILNKYGFKVSSLNIAQVKQECGIIERENYNKPSGKYRQPKCPEHKFNAIKEALEHFKMI
ncbi:MAG: 23S rRNA (uracil(1939)-C(5))-methyltransferase RlmD [Ruminococcaceae bacterium]|nr:23S rRNA (uracil(1939)-C(5))-methyltransferase RlmD [Oscillospiraceae bacterium]